MPKKESISSGTVLKNHSFNEDNILILLAFLGVIVFFLPGSYVKNFIK